MAGLFKNSLFGYNKESVIGYVAESKEKIRRNELEIERLNNELNDSRTMCDKLSEEVAELSNLVNDYRSREEAITRLSESIGKLYLVAKANADSIMTAAKENAESSSATAQKNITAADTAYKEFTRLEAVLAQNITRFSEEIFSLKSSLMDVKEQVRENSDIIENKSSEFDRVAEDIDLKVNA